MDAAMLPAAGVGGGVASKLANRATKGAVRWRPVESATLVVTVTVYAVFACNAVVGRSVSTALPVDRLMVAGTALPSDAVSVMFAAFAPFTVDGSMDREKRRTTGSDSAMLAAPSAGVIAVTRGAAARI